MNNIFAENLIGNTPMVRLKKIEEHFNLNCRLYAKLEWYNLTGSIKDRPALQIILDAEKQGLKPGGMLIEATSGNMGISLAGICQKMGYKAVICMPNNMSEERVKLIKAYGADLYLTDASLGMKGAIDKAEEIFKENENSFKTLQFENPSNPKAHYLTTGPEIYSQLNGSVAGFACGIGTGGTISGIAKFLKEKNSNVVIAGCEPKDSALLTGGKAGSHKIQGIGANFIPKNLNLSLIDQIIDVENWQAFETARKLLELEGLFVGISSGANLFGLIELAKSGRFENKNLVTLFPDSGIKYLSTELFN